MHQLTDSDGEHSSLGLLHSLWAVTRGLPCLGPVYFGGTGLFCDHLFSCKRDRLVPGLGGGCERACYRSPGCSGSSACPWLSCGIPGQTRAGVCMHFLSPLFIPSAREKGSRHFCHKDCPCGLPLGAVNVWGGTAWPELDEATHCWTFSILCFSP